MCAERVVWWVLICVARVAAFSFKVLDLSDLRSALGMIEMRANEILQACLLDRMQHNGEHDHGAIHGDNGESPARRVLPPLQGALPGPLPFPWEDEVIGAVTDPIVMSLIAIVS